ncbi:MAG: hypothetical protein E7652_00145 [Ruminococcaceae bacterium]|nr:hypothetical protein [Oscillospiraceae bacterium]
MKGRELLDKMELIAPEFINEAEEKKPRKVRNAVLIAACIALALSIAVIPLAVKDRTPEKNEDNITDGIEKAASDTDKSTEEAPKESDSYPIPPEPVPDLMYSTIKLLPDDDFVPSEEVADNGVMGDIAPFYESFTEDCDFIEGRVVDVYEKRYEYTVASHKFKEGDRAYCYTYSVIYEFEISRVWRGEYSVGDTVLIEDMQLFCGSQFYMQKGHSYLVPIYNAGEDISIISLNAHTAEGDIKRRTPYSTQYPYHPQIEITLDGYYFFPDEWTTLAEEGPELFRVKDVDFKYGTTYYDDKMVLLDPASFEIRMQKMLSQ